MDEGWAHGNVVEGLSEAFVHKRGYLYLPSNNGMQTRKARTIKHHFGAMKKLLGKSSCKVSLGGGDIVNSEDCVALCLFPC